MNYFYDIIWTCLNPLESSATAASFKCHVQFSFTLLMFGIFFISENTFFNILDPENTQDKSGLDSRSFKWLQYRFRKVLICSHVVVNRNNLLSVFVFRICEWIKEWRRWRSVSVSADTESKDRAAADPVMMLCHIHRNTQGGWWTGHCVTADLRAAHLLWFLWSSVSTLPPSNKAQSEPLYTQAAAASASGSSGHSSASVHTHCPLHTQLH